MMCMMSAVLAGTILTACGSGTADKVENTTESSNTSDQGSESGGERVEITFWDQNASETRTKIYTHLIEEFEEENPDIKINFVPIPAADAKAKYDVAIQSNTAPD